MSWMTLATEAATTTGVDLYGDLLLPLTIGLVGGSVGAALVSQMFASADRRRDNYAEAVAVLLSWCEYPFMIRRRVDDEPTTLQRLADHGHQLQERVARSEAWVTAESEKMGTKYSTLVTKVKAAMGPLLKEAWNSSPASTPTQMNLNGWGGSDGCAGVRQEINEFRSRTFKRFGWRRFTT
jgi:hypothetical protein